MNKEEVLNYLVEHIGVWPKETTCAHAVPHGWTWRQIHDSVLIIRDDFEDYITEKDWSHALTRSPKIPSGTKRIAFVNGAPMYLKLSPNFEIQTFVSGSWCTYKDQDRIARIWDQSKPAKPVNVDSIKVIASSMTRDEWRGFCIGNSLKLRLEAKSQNDMGAAEAYESMFEQYERLNRK